MRFRQGGWTEVTRKGAQMIEETLFDISRPEGCTCPPNTRVVMVSHDYIELEVSKDCTAHAVLMGNMDYDQYTKLKREYFSGRKRSDDDGKLLRAKEYTRREHYEIERARSRVQEAAEKLRVLGDTWRSFSSEDKSNATSLEIARYVQKVRYERNEMRHELHNAERDYRMAVEVPFLRRWKLDQMGRKSVGGVVEHSTKFERLKFMPWEPGMEIKFLDPNYAPPFNKSFLAEEHEKMKTQLDELKKLAEKVFTKKKVMRPMVDTSLRRHLRKK